MVFSMNEIIAGINFHSQPLMLCTASTSAKTCGAITSAVLIRIMLFSDVNTSDKQAKYKQEERRCSFKPSWQLKLP